MRIAVLGQKGGIGKTTFSRLMCEFFSEGFSEAHMSNLSNKDRKQLMPKNMRLWNITRSDLGAGRFADLLAYVDDIHAINFEIFAKKLEETIDDDGVSIFDFGNDTLDMLFEFEKTQEGAQFFSSIDYIFLPIKADDECIKSVEDILEIFEKYEHVTFVFALTEYYDLVDKEFYNFLYATNQRLNKLVKKGRAKKINIPFSRFIRDSQRDSHTLSKHLEILTEYDRENFVKFREELYDSFAYALLGQTQMIIHQKVYSYCEKQSEKEKAYLLNIRDDLNRLSDAVESSLPDLVAVKKLSDIFVLPEANDAIEIVKNKLKELTIRTWLAIIISCMVLPFIVFGLIGYLSGYTVRENHIINEVQSEIRFSNKLSEDLFRYNARNKLQFIEDSKRKVFEIRCIQNDGLCVNRFDAENNIGIFEIKNPKGKE